MTAAVLLALRLPSLVDRRAIVVNGLTACLIAGLATQIKYTAAIEGTFVVAAHLCFLYRTGAPARRLPIAALG